MKTRGIIADTGPLYAAIDIDDQYHQRSQQELKIINQQKLAILVPYSTNRFLLREQYEPKDLFREFQGNLDLIGGVLSGDDTVIEKHYSQVEKAHLINYY